MFYVLCEDGNRRHAKLFDTKAAADEWAWWGHVCTAKHEVIELDEPTPTQEVRTIEVGNLYVGNEVLLPGDICAVVVGFAWNPDSPSMVEVIFEGFPGGRLYSSTDIVEVLS